MLRCDDKIVIEKDYNDTISGSENEYKFFELKTKDAIKSITGQNVICATSYKINPTQRKYKTISFYPDVSDFLNSNDDWGVIRNMFFRSADSEEEASLIINDIKYKHELT